MAAELDVINAALAILGQDPVLDLGSASLGQSDAAFKLTRQINQTRDVVLRRHGWLCALDYVTLDPAILPGYRNWKFPAVYLLPGGSLRVWQIEGLFEHQWFADWGGEGFGRRAGGQRWETGTQDTDLGARQIIRARQGGPLNVAHVRTPSWQAIDVHLADAIGAMLAQRAFRSVKGSDPGADVKAEIEERIALAISVDGTQADSQSRGPSELHLTRLRGAG